MLTIIGYTAVLLLILYGCGYGLSQLLIPANLKKYAFWLMPWLGTILIIWLGVLLSLAKIPINQGKYYIILAAAAFLIYSLIRRKSLIIAFPKENYLLFLLVLLILGINLYSLLHEVGFPTSVSTSNVDVITYVHVGDFLTDHTVYDGKNLERFKTYPWAVGALIHYGYRWGSPTLIAFLNSVMGIKSYQSFTILINLYFCLTFPLVYILAKSAGVQSKYWLMIVIWLVYGLNSTLFFILHNTFFPQTVFTGLYIIILIFSLIFFNAPPGNQKIRSGFGIAVCLCALGTLYPEGVLFPMSALFLYVLYRLIIKTDKQILYPTLGVGISAFLLNPLTAYTALLTNIDVFLKAAKQGEFGFDYLPLPGPMEIMGFYNLLYSRNLRPIIDIMLGLPIVIIWIAGLVKINHKKLFLFFLVTPIILMTLFGIRAQKFPYLKAVTYALFLFSVLFCAGLEKIFIQLKNRYIMGLILGVIVLLSIRSSYRSLYQLYWHPLVVDKSLVSLTELNQNQAITESFFTADVYLGEYNLWRRLWQEYLLSEKKIISRQNFSSEKFQDVQKTKLVLAEKNKLEHEGKNLEYTHIVWQNEYYQLGTIKPIPFDPVLSRSID